MSHFKLEYHDMAKEQIIELINSCLIVDFKTGQESAVDGYTVGKNGDMWKHFVPGKITLTIEMLKEIKT